MKAKAMKPYEGWAIVYKLSGIAVAWAPPAIIGNWLVLLIPLITSAARL